MYKFVHHQNGFTLFLSNIVWEVFIDGISQGAFSNAINQIASLDLYPAGGSEFYKRQDFFLLSLSIEWFRIHIETPEKRSLAACSKFTLTVSFTVQVHIIE